MPTITVPTHATGATTMLMPGLSVPPERAVTPEDLDRRLVVDGLSPSFLAGALSMMLAHERCGHHLYRSVAERTHNPMLQRTYREFGEDTLRHVDDLERLVTALGGDPQYVSPAARATEKAGSGLVQSTFMLAGSIDLLTAEAVMLTAVLQAEVVDHANWQYLSGIVDELPVGASRDLAREICERVEAEEDHHLEWAQQTRLRMSTLQSKSSMASTAAMKMEETTARIASLFD